MATVTGYGGVNPTHQWGYRTASGGAITDIARKTSTSYVLSSADFPTVGTYYLVERSTACGSTATSNDITVTIGSCPAAPANVVATAISISQVGVSWSAVTGADSYDVYRRGPGGVFAFVGNRLTTSYRDNAVTRDTSYLYKVKAVNAAGSSPDSNVDLATTTIFTDDPLVAGTSVVKGDHLSQMRTAVNAVRALAGLGAVTFSDDPPMGATIKSAHVVALRAALDEAWSSLFPLSLTYQNAAAIGDPIRALDFTEIRNVTK